MAPQGTPKGNFKTYEGQARLLRAIVAAHPDVKWDYKKIVQAHGSDMTKFALEHRMKDIKAQVKLINSAIKAGVDCAEIPADLPKGEKAIAQMYGSSTADGIQWQFRSIKKDADALRNGVKKGESATLNLGTPKAKGGGVTKRAAPQSRPSAKRQKTYLASDDKDEDQDDDDDAYSDNMDDTPSHRRGKKEETDSAHPFPSGTPSRRATSTLIGAFKAKSIDLTSEDEVVTPPAPFNDEPLPIKMEQQNSIFGDPHTARASEKQASSTAASYMNGAYTDFSRTTPSSFDDFLEGEI